MTFEELIIDKFGPLFAGRLYFDTSPQGWTPNEMAAPFCIVNQVGGTAGLYVDNTEHDMLNSELQFFVWGARRTEVTAAARALATVVAASNTATFVANPQAAAVADWNESLQLRGSRQTFRFWYTAN